MASFFNFYSRIKRHWLRLILFLGFAAIVFISTTIARLSAAPESATACFQKQLHQKEKKAIQIVATLFSDELQSPCLFGSDTENAVNEAGFHLFLFYQGVLSYWSDNQSPVSEEQWVGIHSDTVIHTGNGWSFLKFFSRGDYTACLLIPVKFDYHYENRYLINGFAEGFSLCKKTRLAFDENIGEPVYSSNGDYLFSLDFTFGEYIPALWVFVSTLAYFLALLFFALFILDLYRILPLFRTRPLTRTLLFSADIALLGFILKGIGLPSIIKNSELFSSSLFAHSFLLASLGDLLVFSILFFIVAFAWFTEVKGATKRSTCNKVRALIVSFISIFVLLIVQAFSFHLIYSLVINSTISFDLTSLFELNVYSLIGFLILSLLVFSSWMVTISALRYLCQRFISKKEFVFLFLGVLVLAIMASLLGFSPFKGIVLFASVLFFISCMVHYGLFSAKLDSGIVVFLLGLFSFLSGLVLLQAGKEKLRAEMKTLALSVSNQRDRIAEYLFDEAVVEMQKDTVLLRLAGEAVYMPGKEGDLEEHIRQHYLTGYWKQFDYQFTVCDTMVELKIHSDGDVLNCYDFFSHIIARYGQPTFGDKLFFINDSSGLISYLGRIRLSTENSEAYPVTIFVDIMPKFVQEGLGYPELMIDEQFLPRYDYSGYSWALFMKGSLIRYVGDYFYSSKLERYNLSDENQFFKHNSWIHYKHNAGEGSTLIVSRPSDRIIDIVAPFSYLFLFFAIIALLLIALVFLFRYDRVFRFTTRNRLQLSMTGFLFLALAVVGYSSVRYILVLNSDKNRQALQEKAHSVLTELEHKLISDVDFDAEMQAYLSSLFIKWSNVFFSDINLYKPDGKLLVSSRPEIFSENLTSRRMDASAYKALALDRKTQFIGEEKIGEYSYLSAWVQFRNADNELLAYLNLPFFARQSELSREVSAFLMTFINIYVFLIVIALLLGLLLSNIISKPLERIREKIAHLSLGSDNEKLVWLREDEIGALVKEYNNKVDELAHSAERLVQTERETAWREMARQVAHEIKNPLTPMKLSVQYLQRAWEDNAPDWDQRLKRFTDTMTEQIDSMAEIATAFSDFAKMPKAQREILDLNDLIRKAVDLFASNPDVAVVLSLQPSPMPVYADSKQLLRVFNNLLKNSYQALDSMPNGEIEIRSWIENESLMVLFTDNGPGISMEVADKIFAPNFTTKSGGMGLGLAMVKNIILNSGGQVWFESGKNKAPHFFLSLPMYLQANR